MKTKPPPFFEKEAKQDLLKGDRMEDRDEADRWERGEQAFEMALDLLGEDATPEEIYAFALELLAAEEVALTQDLSPQEIEALEAESAEQSDIPKPFRSVADRYEMILRDAEAKEAERYAARQRRAFGKRTIEEPHEDKRPFHGEDSEKDELPRRFDEPSEGSEPSLFQRWKAYLQPPPLYALVTLDATTQTAPASAFSCALQPSRSKQTQAGIEYAIKVCERISFSIEMAQSASIFVFEEPSQPSQEAKVELVYPATAEEESKGWAASDLQALPAIRADLFDFLFDEPQTLRWFIFFCPTSLWEMEPSLPSVISLEEIVRFFSKPREGVIGFSFLLSIEP